MELCLSLLVSSNTLRLKQSPSGNSLITTANNNVPAFWGWGGGAGEESGDSWLNSHRSERGAGLALCRNRTPGSLATHLACVCACASVCVSFSWMNICCARLSPRLLKVCTHTLILTLSFIFLFFPLLAWIRLLIITLTQTFRCYSQYNDL